MNEETLKDIPMLDANDPDFATKLEFEMWSTQASSDYRNDRERPYNGQPWTDHGERGKTEVKGVTMRDIRDCMTKAILMCAGAYTDNWREQQLYDVDLNTLDPVAVMQNTTCEIEKMMGIYPNIPKTHDE